MRNKDNPLYFPPQKVPTSKRTDKWFRECVQAAEDLVAYGKDFETHRKMQVWEDLDNDIIDEQEIERVFNPMELDNVSFPASLKNYPLSVPKIDLLQGEEIKRRFDWNVTAMNEESHSFASKALKDDIIDLLLQEIQAEATDEEKFQQAIQDTVKYYKYDFKDWNEISATRVLQYLWRQQTLKEKFSTGFRDALVKGREIYRVDIVGGEPTVERVDPQKVYFVRKPNSHKIEDADIIVEINYEPIGKIIDEFHDHLKPSEIAELESGYDTLATNQAHGGTLNHVNGFPLMLVNTDIGGNDPMSPVNQVVNYGLPYDSEGNIRTVRVRWLGRRKIGRLTYFNPNTGEEEERLVSENYKPDQDLGERVKWFWINEAMKGTQLANKFFVDMDASEIQMRHFDNPSKCFLGYVGTDYGKSLMSRMEPLQYAYNVYMRRLELVIARYKGPIEEIDFSKKPAEWTAEMWMYYQDVLGKYVVDSFNEGDSGAARGKLAGAVSNTSGGIRDANPGAYIRELIGMLQYIENQIGEISGVNKQRQGQIENRETVGGVERAVAQSSHITERWFYIHDETKKRVITALLDTAKQAWKHNKSKKISFIMDDMSKQMIDLNGEDFASSEFDLFITNSSEDMEIRQALKQLSQAAVQNGASITIVTDILRSDSITEMTKKLQEEEEQRLARQEQQQQQQVESAERMKQAELQDKQADRELKYYEIDTKAATDIEKELIKLSGQNTEEDGTDNSDLEQRKLLLQERKQQLEERKNQQTQTLGSKQLAETVRHNKATEQISKQKPKTTSK